MKRLLLIGSHSIHTLRYYHLIQPQFDEVKIVCDSDNGSSDLPVSEIVNCSFRSPHKIFGAVKRLRRIIADFRPSIIHILQVGTTSCCALRANKPFGIPTIVTAMGSDILINPERNFLFKKIVQYTLNHGDYFTSDSTFMAEKMRKLSSKELNITIANFGIESLALPVAKENIIYSNRLHKPLYRIDRIIKAFHTFSRQHDDWKLVIAGSGEETDSLQQLCRQLAIEEKVQFIGWVDADTNRQYYAKARFWVSIPESDATSISLLEAMQAGCIPVVSDLPANREWIQHMHNGLIVKDTEKDFLSCAFAVNAEAAATANRQIVEQYATKEVNRRKFIDTYHQAKPPIRRICHMSSAHPAKDVRIFTKECQSIAEAGYDVSLVVPHTCDEQEGGVHILHVPKEERGRYYRMSVTARQVFERALSVDADLYHIHDPELIPWGLKLKRAGKKVIFDSHENVPLQIMTKNWIPKPLRPLLAALYRQYERHTLRQMDALVTVNEEIAARLRQIQPVTAVVTNFPILREFTPATSFEERDYICFAGNIKDEYRHHLIMEALHSCENVRYLLAGIADKPYLEKLRQVASWDKVDYRGVLPHEQVFDIYNHSFAGMCIHAYTPNVGGQNGGLGFIKNFEMMMAGLPIICSKFKVWEEIVNRYQCGICVNPDSSEEIAQAIQHLATHREEAFQMGLRGRQAVEELYNWNSQKAVLLNLIQSL